MATKKSELSKDKIVSMYMDYVLEHNEKPKSVFKFSKINNNLEFFFKKNRIIIFYSYYFYNLKLKLNLIMLYNFYKKNKISSIDKLYKNASWLERETSEMFGINYYNKKDIRKLLLDYSKVENPLLKDFPTEGFSEVFYDFFEDQVVYLNNDSIEL